MDTDRIFLENFIAKHPLAAARVLEGLKAEEVAAFVRDLPKEKSLQLLNLMNVHKAAQCFSLLPPQLAKELMETSDITFAESLCRYFDTSFRDRLLDSLSPDLSTILRQKMEQKANTVGLFMQPVIMVNKEMLVQDALEIIKRNNKTPGSYLYIVDVQGIFEGVVGLEELLLAERNVALEQLMCTTIPRFFPDTPIRNIQDHPAWYEYRSIPVTDRSEKLLGALDFKNTKETAPKNGGQLTKEILETGTALGELYLIGLSGFLQSVGK